jgi:hypothetical protein
MAFLLVSSSLVAGELKPETLAAWDAYAQTAQKRATERNGAEHFLWMDEEPARASRVRAGGIVVAPVEAQTPKPVAHGLIHDWIGVAFIPDAKISDVLAVVQDYDRYKEFYLPGATDSKLMSHEDQRYAFLLTLVNKAVLLKTGLETQGEATYSQLSDTRSACVVRTTRIREIVNIGQANEQRLPPDQGNGFIWRLLSFSRLEERDGGVYVELEAIALTRDVPVALRWFVNPLVRNLSRGSLTTSLRQTSAAVRARCEHKL